jgi:osmotically-inducible protein OsmY
MLADSVIKKEVEDELRWDPDIGVTDIGVAVKNGIVTLTGFVRSYAQRWQAETDAKRVAGVRGVANDLEVRLPIIHKRPDPEIARDAVRAIHNRLPNSAENIKLIVRDGVVTLEGEVEWHYQRQRAERAVRRVRGVVSVFNGIVVKPKAPPDEIKRAIEDAFIRNAEIDAARITVEVKGGEVTLKGTVRSWAERYEAERVAWSAPGVGKVNNQIKVTH